MNHFLQQIKNNERISILQMSWPVVVVTGNTLTQGIFFSGYWMPQSVGEFYIYMKKLNKIITDVILEKIDKYTTVTKVRQYISAVQQN